MCGGGPRRGEFGLGADRERHAGLAGDPGQLQCQGAFFGRLRIVPGEAAGVRRIEALTGEGVKAYFAEAQAALDETAALFDQILINGGQRGLLLGLAPDEAVRAAAARLVDLTA